MEYIVPVLDWIVNNVDSILQIIGAFAIIATWTKNESDNKIIQFIEDVINLIAMNFGNAKNDPGK